MLAVLGRRVVQLVATLLFASIVIFLLMQLIPGDPAQAIAGEQASIARVEEVRQQLGLNDPLYQQYGHWIWGVIHGDLGNSVITNESIWATIVRTVPRTALIVAGGLLIGVLAGIPLGILAATKARTAVDSVVRVIATSGIAIPNFWLGLLLISFFALTLGLLPAGGYVSPSENLGKSLEHLILPSVALGLHAMSQIARQTRSAMLEALQSDSIRTLTAMGVSRRQVVWRHALKNSSIPIATTIGLDISHAVGAAVVIEAVFGIPGLGSRLVDATHLRDFPVVQGILLVAVLWIVVVNLIVDVAYNILDPRTRKVSSNAN
ncbi:peptide/nickel transport system permease protein [Antricoccus suffuscus]|uniref:Peptide/nickel transport system permease protein n=1 Tax=Antricoccus suffuscus TaxID=1629062 RepID=A0A2T0ZTP6_9ACTN|nr:ABC transporter permease [Antricoccus suffuscus]PRZ39722.1 peptide/nickel transport system permease protein [Antricoccus suffuscus]